MIQSIIESAAPDQTTVEAGVFETRFIGRSGSGHFDAEQVMLEAGVATTGLNGAVASDGEGGCRGDGEVALLVRVVVQAVEVAAVFTVLQAEQAQAIVELGAFGGVGSTERGFEQVNRILIGAVSFFLGFEDNGVTNADVDAASVGLWVVDG